VTIPRYCFDIGKCRDIDNSEDKKQRDSHSDYAGANCKTQIRSGSAKPECLGISLTYHWWVGLADKDGPRDLSEFQASKTFSMLLLEAG